MGGHLRASWEYYRIDGGVEDASTPSLSDSELIVPLIAF
jgi:hypothetical protein